MASRVKLLVFFVALVRAGTSWAQAQQGFDMAALPGLESMQGAAVPTLIPDETNVTKSRVERPFERLIESSTPAPAVPPAIEPVLDPATKVAPGRVSWHGDVDAAIEAARRTSKPVLLFQLLGKLDDAYC